MTHAFPPVGAVGLVSSGGGCCPCIPPMLDPDKVGSALDVVMKTAVGFLGGRR